MGWLEGGKAGGLGEGWEHAFGMDGWTESTYTSFVLLYRTLIVFTGYLTRLKDRLTRRLTA